MARDEWLARYADPGYATVRADDAGGGAKVETHWVGWVSCVESPPRPFLVRLVERTELGWVWGRATWHATESEALAEHGRVLAAAKGGGEAGR
jgi:hypothetical protein